MLSSLIRAIATWTPAVAVVKSTAMGAWGHESFANDGDTVTFAAGDEPLELLLIGGVPLKEPVVRYGPFVMNTDAEIRQAIDDYRSGRLVSAS